MRRFSIILAAIVVVAAVLVIGPRLVDWGAYRGAIAGEIDAATGLALRIDGPIRFVLLPTPRLRVADITVATDRGAGTPVLLRARALDLRLTLGRLLSGRIAAHEIVLVDPVARLDRLAAALPERRLAWLFEPPGRAGIARLSIVGGQISYGQEGAGARLTHVTLALARSRDSGAVHLDGSFIRDGNAFSLIASSTGGAAPAIELDLAALGSGARLGLAGTLAPGADGLALSGRLNLVGPSLAATFRDFGPADAAPLPAAAFALSGRLSAELGAGPRAGRLRLDGVALRCGALRASGEADVTLAATPSFTVSLAIPILDLDRLGLDELGLGRAAPALLARLPDRWRGRVSAHIDAVSWHGRLARRLIATANLAHGRVSGTIGALLPGGGQAHIIGTLGATSGPHAVPQATGTIALRADDLRALLRAGGLAPSGGAADHLRRAVLSTRFSVEPDRVALDAIDLDLDATKITGQMGLTLGSRPALTAHLAADTLDLAGYLPDGAGARGLAGRVAQAARAADFDLDATIGTLVVGGRPLQHIHLAARAVDGRITIADATIGEIGGASARVSGTLDDLAAEPPRVSLRVALAGPTLAAVLLPASRGRLADALASPFSLEGTIDSADGGTPGLPSPGAIDAELRIALLGGKGTIAGTLSLSPALRVAGHVAFAFPSYAGLLDDFALGAAAEKGPVAVTTDFTGGEAGLRFAALAVALGAQTLSGDARLSLAGAPRVTAALSGGTIALDSLVPHGGLALLALPPIAVDVGLDARHASWGDWQFDAPHLHVATAGATLSADAAASGFLGGSLTGSLALRAGTPPQATVALHLANVDLARLVTDDAGQAIALGRTTADLSASAGGDGIGALGGALSGTAALTAGAGALTGIDLPALAAAVAAPAPNLRQALQGSTPFTRLALACTIAAGIIHCPTLNLALAGGVAHGSLRVDLPGQQLSGGAEIRLASPPSAPPIMLLLSGPIRAPHRSFDLTALEAYAKARLTQLP